MRRYGWLWILFVKSIAVYIADIYTLVALLASNRWAASILQSEAAQGNGASSNVLEVPFSVSPARFPSLTRELTEIVPL